MTTTTADLATIRNQHGARIREEALRIQEFAGYILARVEAGHADAVGMYAADIVAAGQRIMTGNATIQGLDISRTKTERHDVDRAEHLQWAKDRGPTAPR